MSTVFKAAVEQAMAQGDPTPVEDILSPDVVFRSPAVYKPYEGREAVMTLLKAVFEVFEDFRYVDELHGDETDGFVFRARAGDRDVEGWDYVRTGDDGLVTELVVMIRPLSGLIALAEAMAKKLGVAPAAG